MKTVLITGGTRGIGYATAKVFASHGYTLILSYCNKEEHAKKAKKKLEESYSVSVFLIQLDLSKEEQIKENVNQILQQFSTIDCLVNNAGIAIDTCFEDKTKENFLKTLEVNLIGPFLLSRLIGDQMEKQGFGSIINVSSTNGLDTNYPESLDYDASKAGLISLTHNLANHYGKTIRVNAVAPGWVRTDMNQELEEEFIQKETSKILLGRFAEAEEIAKVIYFLASSDASYIQDEIIRIDGGIKR